VNLTNLTRLLCSEIISSSSADNELKTVVQRKLLCMRDVPRSVAVECTGLKVTCLPLLHMS
jgi:hypothetical protein